jgi:hypothetical protein
VCPKACVNSWMMATAANSTGDPKYQASALATVAPKRYHVVATPCKSPGQKRCVSHADDAEDDRNDPN